MPTTQLRVVSFGGGVQSTALLVLAAQGRIDHDTFVFANVGDDSEAPATLRYLAEHARPYAETHGLRLVETRRLDRHGDPFPTVREHVMSDRRSLVIPVRMANGSPGNRKCTPFWKIKVVTRWCVENGATEASPARVAIGFSTDEWTRATRRTDSGVEVIEHPLLDLGMSRTDCAEVIASAGLPVPPKSACSFCPFRLPSDFVTMARDDPAEFTRVAELEDRANEKRAAMGKDKVWLTRFARPLREVVELAGAQQTLALYDEDEGHRCGDVCDT